MCNRSRHLGHRRDARDRIRHAQRLLLEMRDQIGTDRRPRPFRMMTQIVLRRCMLVRGLLGGAVLGLADAMENGESGGGSVHEV